MEYVHSEPGGKHKLLFLLVIPLLLAVVYAGYRHVLREKAAAAIAEIQATGEPVTLAELNAWYAEPPPLENAAVHYLDACDMLTEIAEIRDSVPIVGNAELPGLIEPLPEEMLEAIERCLKANERALHWLYQAAALPESRYPVDLTDDDEMHLPHLAKLRQAARLLMLEAVYYAEYRDRESVTRAILAGLAIGRSLREEPVLMPQLVRLACNRIVFENTERALNRTDLTDEQLAVLIGAFAEAEYPQGMTRGLVGDGCYVLTAFENRYGFQDLIRGTKEHATCVRLLAGFHKWTGVADLDKAACATWMSKVVQASKHPFPESLDLARAIEDGMRKLPAWRTPVTRYVVPALLRTFTECGRDVAYMRTAQVALGVERFRLATGTLPETTSQLVPVHLSSLLEDPFDGEPLRYRLTTNGYIVYSIGQNRKDEGGKKAARSILEGDLTLTIERPFSL